MFINKLNQLYKPKRILYYIDATGEEITDFCLGNSTPWITKYKNSFGVWKGMGGFREICKTILLDRTEATKKIYFSVSDTRTASCQKMQSLIFFL